MQETIVPVNYAVTFIKLIKICVCTDVGVVEVS